ncbi:hypothetical protein Val02_44590 [Virgisporangium aliadipatigenens]|uniref:Uncharacterized protein n=1 Tax=Virgisporangium aliadipatigenens TaxID=741659 RepID=A0A8J3YPR8_9ACTN|nr:hypothetical protein [Virgisporangium aliadipatigenens]GIJ47573.1 hypothetical protein Val02_44590 [Virgisporangium aliadipatigenens]
MPSVDEDRSSLRSLFTIERPPPQPPAVRRLRRLVLLTALATIAVDLVNLEYAVEGGFTLTVRTVYALLRAVGFLVLMRTIRYGRVVSRPFGLILAATTVFAVGRLVVPRSGELLPQAPVLVGFALLAALNGAVLWGLFRTPVIAAHLTRRGPGRQVSAGVLTARVAGLSYSALLLVPCLVAIGTLVHEPRVPRAVGVPVVIGWFVLALVLGFAMPWVMIFVVFGKRLARDVVAVVSVGVLVGGPLLCLWMLGVDGLLRDGVPLVIAALTCMGALWQTRRHA